MKGVVIYNGKYGATKQYAEGIGKKLSLPIITSGEINGDGLYIESLIDILSRTVE